MDQDEQEPRPGSVPNAYGNALAWKWSRSMPAELRRRRGYITLLYTLRAMASASGELRFSGGRPFRIQDLAAAATIREKDARRYLDASVRAGVVAIVGERRRGTPTLYALVVSPFPDWNAAEAYLRGTDRASGKDAAPWQGDESSGTRGPNTEFGPPRPEVADSAPEGVRATAAPPGSGRGGPTGSGTRGPNTPGGFHEGVHEGAGVGAQPQDACARDVLEDGPAGRDTPTLRAVPRPPGGRAPAPGGRQDGSSQRPLLLPVRSPAQVSPQELAALRAAATEDEVRQAITELGHAQAIRVYGHRLVAPLLAELPDHNTGT